MDIKLVVVGLVTNREILQGKPIKVRLRKKKEIIRTYYHKANSNNSI